jgi:hypothetical protein
MAHRSAMSNWFCNSVSSASYSCCRTQLSELWRRSRSGSASHVEHVGDGPILDTPLARLRSVESGHKLSSTSRSRRQSHAAESNIHAAWAQTCHMLARVTVRLPTYLLSRHSKVKIVDASCDRNQGQEGTRRISIRLYIDYYRRQVLLTACRINNDTFCIVLVSAEK